MQKVKMCFSNTAVTTLSTQNDKGANFLHVIRHVREFAGDNCSMLGNAAGQTLLWIRAIAWLETDREELSRLKVHVLDVLIAWHSMRLARYQHAK